MWRQWVVGTGDNNQRMTSVSIPDALKSGEVTAHDIERGRKLEREATRAKLAYGAVFGGLGFVLAAAAAVFRSPLLAIPFAVLGGGMLAFSAALHRKRPKRPQDATSSLEPPSPRG